MARGQRLLAGPVLELRSFSSYRTEIVATHVDGGGNFMSLLRPQAPRPEGGKNSELVSEEGKKDVLVREEGLEGSRIGCG